MLVGRKADNFPEFEKVRESASESHKVQSEVCDAGNSSDSLR